VCRESPATDAAPPERRPTISSPSNDPKPVAEDRWLFLRKFLRHGTRVASIRPSSRHLAGAVCRYVTPDQPQVILELGAGTGAVTKVAVERLHPESQLLAVEIDADFAAILAQTCPRATVLQADVRDLTGLLAERGITRVDLVLSGLPVPSLPKVINQAVFEAVRDLAADAWFSQLTLMPWCYLGTYRRLFESVDFQLVARDFPPTGAYHCRKLRPDFAERLPGK